MNTQSFSLINEFLLQINAALFFLYSQRSEPPLPVHIGEISIFRNLTQPDAHFAVPPELFNSLQRFKKGLLCNFLGNLLVPA
ncbi:hypothetical protein D3C76_1623420 [compost metagenome]